MTGCSRSFRVSVVGCAPVGSDKGERLVRVSIGQARLVGLGFRDAIVAHQRQRREIHAALDLNGREALRRHDIRRQQPHVVAVCEGEVSVEALAKRQELALIAEVPLADDPGGVPPLPQRRGESHLAAAQADRVSREQHVEALPGFEADTLGVAAGHERGARRRA